LLLLNDLPRLFCRLENILDRRETFDHALRDRLTRRYP